MAPSRVIICGGGIVGTSVAYYLSRRGVAATLVDQVGICPAASGKAAGFLALDWSDGSPLGPLARRGFEEHAKLATQLDAQIGYRRLTCESVSVGRGQTKPRKLPGVEWADIGVTGHRPMGGEDTIAQVHPKLLTEALWAEAERAGCRLLVGEVQDVELGGGGGVSGVVVDGLLEPADAVVIAMGPWSDRASAWLGLPPTHGTKYHSVLMQAAAPLSQAVFFDGLGIDPEVYPRPDSTVYVTGLPDRPAAVVEAPGHVELRPEVTARLAGAARSASSTLAEAPVVAESACHLPCTPDGVPMIGAVPGAAGAFVATGHSCWGVLCGPATGLALSELILDGASSSVDLAPFAPSRLM